MAGEGSSSQPGAAEDPSELLDRLRLEEDELDDLVWEEEIDSTEEGPKWLAIARVLTGKSFGQGALMADMRAAWNPAHKVIWRIINPNLFTIQFSCLADWNKALHQGPWDFRGFGALIIVEYDGFSNPESIKLNKLETWSRIYKLPDAVLKNEGFVKNLAKRIGEVQEVQITLPSGFVGEFIRVRTKLDVDQKLTRFVSFTRGGKTEFYQVKYEKLPTFCFACGKLGHWHQECGSGEYEEDKLQWGSFILAPRRGRGVGRDTGRQGGASRGDHMSGRGRGFGRGGDGGSAHPRSEMDKNTEFSFPRDVSWRWNSVAVLHADGRTASETDTNVAMVEAGGSAKKRLAMDQIPPLSEDLNMVPSDNVLTVVERVVQSEPVGGLDTLGTPQKNANKKKLKANNGVVVDTKEVESPNEVDDGLGRGSDEESEKIVDGNFSKAGAVSPSPGSAGSNVGSVRQQ